MMKRKWISIATLFLATVGSRLIWLTPDPGWDPDAWRVLQAAKQIAETGDYVASRLPGYPVYEYLVALLPITTNALYPNGATILFSAIATVLFAFILQYFGIKQAWLLALSFAMTPIIYLNSANTMDYMLALALMLGSTYFVLTRRYIIAGGLLGLAVGSRITSGAIWLPLAWWIYQERDQNTLKNLLLFSLTAFLVAAASFMPVVRRYGLDFFTFADNAEYPSLIGLISLGVVKVWGVIGSIGLLALGGVALFNVSHIKNVLLERHVKRGAILALLVIALYAISFLRLPHESAYLMPMVPFALLVVALLMPHRFVRYFAILLLVSSFFITIYRDGRIEPAGPIVENYRFRIARTEETNRVVATVNKLAEKSIIVSGWKLQPIQIHPDKGANVNHQYVFAIRDDAAYEQYLEQGFRVYFLEEIDDFNLRIQGVDLRAKGAEMLK